MKKILLILAFSAAAFSADSRASAQELYSSARSAEQIRDWKQTAKYSQALIKAHHESPFISDALFMLAHSCYQLGELNSANRHFSEYLKTQTTPENFERALKYKFDIAGRFADGAKMHLLNVRYLPKLMSAKEYAIEIFDEVIATLPRHELASEALYRKAKLLYELEDFRPAVEAYQTLIRRFPKHPRAPESYLGIGDVYLKQCEVEFKAPEYLDLAKLNYQKFLNDFPGEERLNVAHRKIMSMEEEYAADLFEMGDFFERTKKHQAAALYYHNILKRFPDTKIATKAKQRLFKLNYSRPEQAS